jgi:hypothetical protein
MNLEDCIIAEDRRVSARQVSMLAVARDVVLDLARIGITFPSSETSRPSHTPYWQLATGNQSA